MQYLHTLQKEDIDKMTITLHCGLCGEDHHISFQDNEEQADSTRPDNREIEVQRLEKQRDQYMIEAEMLQKLAEAVNEQIEKIVALAKSEE